MTARGNNTHFVQRHTTKISFRAKHGADANFFTLAAVVALVATGGGSHGDEVNKGIFNLNDDHG